MTRATAWLLGISLLPILGAGSAFAQSAAPAKSPGETAEQTDDIVVTARKRAETSQTVPIALDVASEQDLVHRSVINVTEIQQQTPSIRFSPAALNPTGVYLSARGLFVADTRLTTDTALAIYTDGVYIPRAVGLGVSDLYDASRIEVLKGPQGTLYGKNSTAGAINIYYNEPTDDYSGKLRIRVAEHEELSGAAVVNAPLGTFAALRVVGQVITRGGYGTNLLTGTRLGELHSQNIRGTLRIRPTEGLKVTLRADYLSADATGMAYKGGSFLAGSGLAEVRAELGLANTPANNAIAVAAYTNNALGNPNDASLDVDPFSKTRSWGYSATVDYDVSGAVSIKSITAQREVRDNSAADLDGSPFSLLAFPVHVIRDHQFSQEVQLSSNLLDNRLNLIVGGYYARETGYEKTANLALGLLSAATGATINEGYVENETVGGFAQGTVKATDHINITGGLRYTKDSRALTSNNYNNAYCQSTATNFSATYTLAQCTTGLLSQSFKALSWTASVDYQPTDHTLFYVRADRSYRAGGIPFTGGARPNASLTPAQNLDVAAGTYTPIAPEYALSFEGGFKLDLLKRKLRLNASYYNVKYTGLQRTSTKVLPGSSPPVIINFIGNVAAARVQGVEADATFRPVDGLELGGALSYLHPKYLSYTVGGVDYSSVPFIEAPTWTYSLSGAYTFAIGDGKLRSQLDYSWQDKTVVGTIQTVAGNVVTNIYNAVRPSNNSLNGRIGYEMSNGISVAIFAKNLTNFQYGTYPLVLQTSLGINTNGGTNAPRTFGLEINADF